MEIIFKDKEAINDYLSMGNGNIIEKYDTNNPSVLILGNYDGIHLGHIKIIKEARKKADKLGMKLVIFLFKEHLFKNEQIFSLDEKLYVLDGLKVDVAYIEDMNDIKDMNPISFFNEIIVNKLNAKELYYGFNYKFGKNHSGDTKLIEKIIKDNKLDININVQAPLLVKCNNTNIDIVESYDIDKYEKLGYDIVSTTIIKKYLKSENISQINNLLPKGYIIMGEVVKGRQIGRTLGFPTANLDYREKQLYPVPGVYGVKVKIENDPNEYDGLMNIGMNPTVGGTKYTIETHIFDFDKDIYDKRIVVKIIDRLRCERKMNGLKELKEQISLDKKYWRDKIESR